MNPYQVKIDAFEGPLDLLLHLIQRYEIDIYDIPVAKITEQYMQYIHTMQELQLDIASEYLVMAATLLAIKSQMLLPKREDPEPFESYEEDPREELMQRLLEYKKFKEAAMILKERESAMLETYTRPPKDLSEYTCDKEEEDRVLEVSLYDMLKAVQKLLSRKKYHVQKQAKIQRQEIPIAKRMQEILVELDKGKGEMNFHELFSYPTKTHVVVTFLALLELIKKREIFCYQNGLFQEIWIERQKGV